MGRPPSVPPPHTTGKLTARRQSRHLSPSPLAWCRDLVIVSVEWQVWSGEIGVVSLEWRVCRRGFFVVSGVQYMWQLPQRAAFGTNQEATGEASPPPLMYRILTSSCAPLKTLWVSCKGSKGTQNRNAGARGTQKKCCAGTWEHGTRKQNRGTGGTRDAKAHRNARPSLGYRYILYLMGLTFTTAAWLKKGSWKASCRLRIRARK